MKQTARLGLALLLASIALTACFRSIPPPNGGGGGTGGDGPQFAIISPAAGEQVGGAAFFAIAPLRPADVASVRLSIDGAVVTPRFEAENDFRVFLVAKDYPAGPLTLSATVVGVDGRARTQAIEVRNVPQPPSEVTVGPDGAVLGAAEADGSISVLRLPPGAAEGLTVRFDAMTQEQVKDDTGVDYDALGVTFLGAQRIGTDARFDAPLAITSGGFGPRVQPGQAVVNYMIADDGTGNGALSVVNSASVAPDGSVITDPVPLPQVGAVAEVTSAGRVSTQQVDDEALSGTPGDVLSLDVQGFNPYAALGNVARFRGSDGLTIEAIGILRGSDGMQRFVVAVPPLPPGLADLTLVNLSTGLTVDLAIDILPTPALTRPADEIISDFLNRRVTYLRSELARIRADPDFEPSAELVERAEAFIAAYADFERAFAGILAADDPALQSILERSAAAIENALQSTPLPPASIEPVGAIRPQALTCDGARDLLDTALVTLNAIDGILAATACATALLIPTPATAAACLLGATFFFLGQSLDYAKLTDLFPCPPDGLPRFPFAGPTGNPLDQPRLITGMGSIFLASGELAGSVGGGIPEVAPTASGLSTRSIPTARGRYQVTGFTIGSFGPFTGVTDAGGYFYLPGLNPGPIVARVRDLVTNETRDVDLVSTPVGEANVIFVDFSPRNRAPVASAGPNRSITLGATATLDGSDSFDPDADPLTYAWTLVTRPTGSSATITGADQPIAQLTPDLAGNYTARLTVSDGIATSADTMSIGVTVAGENQAPVANAGPNRSIALAAAATLDGSDSFDPDGDPLTFAWTLVTRPTGSSATITDFDQPIAQLTPDLAGSYTARLTVSDGALEASDDVELTAEADPRPVLTLGETVNGILEQNESTTYVVDADAGQELAVVARRFASSLNATVTIERDGVIVAGPQAFGTNPTVAFVTAEQAGRYAITVATSGTSTGAFSLVALAPESTTLDQNLSFDAAAAGQARAYAFDVGASTSAKLVRFGVASTQELFTPSGALARSDSLYVPGKIPLATGRHLLVVTSSAAGSVGVGLSEMNPPEPLTFDAFGRAAIEAAIEVHGDVLFYAFDAPAGAGAMLVLDGHGDAPLTNGAEATLFRLDGRTFDTLLNSNEVAALDSTSLFSTNAVLDAKSLRLPATDAYVVMVRRSFTPSEAGLGGFTLRLDLVAPSAAITVDDDLACPGAATRSLHAALAAVEENGTVDVCAGTYPENVTPIIDRQGVTLRGAGPAVVVLPHDGFLASGEFGLRIRAPNVTVEGLTAEGALPSNSLSGLPGVQVESTATGVTLRDVRVRPGSSVDQLRTGVYVGFGASGATLERVRVEDADRPVDLTDTSGATIVDSEFVGRSATILGTGANHRIEGNTFLSTTGGQVLNLYGAGGYQVLENQVTVATTGEIGITLQTHAFSIGDNGGGTGPSTIRGNTIVSNEAGIQLTIFPGSPGVVIEQNHFTLGGSFYAQLLDVFVVDSAAPIAVLTLRNNVADALSSEGTIKVTGTHHLAGFDVVNNTFRAAPNAATGSNRNMVDLQASGAPAGALPVRVANNVFVGRDTTTALRSPVGLTVDADHNLFHLVGTRYVGGGTTTGGNDVAGDPLFASALLEVEAGSPAVDAGASAPTYAVPAVDFSGIARPQGAGVDIGAHER